MTTKYGFEAKVDGVWSAEACGHQGPDNYFDTKAEAEAEVDNLARALRCSAFELRVVPVEVQS